MHEHIDLLHGREFFRAAEPERRHEPELLAPLQRPVELQGRSHQPAAKDSIDVVRHAEDVIEEVQDGKRYNVDRGQVDIDPAHVLVLAVVDGAVAMRLIRFDDSASTRREEPARP